MLRGRGLGSRHPYYENSTNGLADRANPRLVNPLWRIGWELHPRKRFCKPSPKLLGHRFLKNNFIHKKI